MGKCKLYGLAVVIILGSLIWTYLSSGGTSPSKISVIQSVSNLPKGEIEILESVDLLEDKEWIVYRTKDQKLYGTVVLQKIMGVWYQPRGGVKIELSEQTPLVRTKPSRDGKEMIFVATDDPEVAYISSGIEDEDFTQEEIRALTLEDVLAHPDSYRVEEVTDGYALFVWHKPIDHEQSSRNSSILCFDQEGRLIIDATGTLHGEYVHQ